MCLQSVLFQLQQHLFDKSGLLLISKMLQSTLYFAGPSVSQRVSKAVFPFSHTLEIPVLYFLRAET